jgi:hypothetical protein
MLEPALCVPRIAVVCGRHFKLFELENATQKTRSLKRLHPRPLYLREGYYEWRTLAHTCTLSPIGQDWPIKLVASGVLLRISCTLHIFGRSLGRG